MIASTSRAPHTQVWAYLRGCSDNINGQGCSQYSCSGSNKSKSDHYWVKTESKRGSHIFFLKTLKIACVGLILFILEHSYVGLHMGQGNVNICKWMCVWIIKLHLKVTALFIRTHLKMEVQEKCLLYLKIDIFHIWSTINITGLWIPQWFWLGFFADGWEAGEGSCPGDSNSDS